MRLSVGHTLPRCDVAEEGENVHTEISARIDAASGDGSRRTRFFFGVFSIPRIARSPDAQGSRASWKGE